MSSTRILIIDDDEATRLVMQLMLARAGYQTEMAVDGLKALEIAERFIPQLIILDMSMPGMNGLSFAQEYRHRVAKKALQTPVFIGVSVEDQYLEHAAASGIDDFLVKPFSADEFLNAVARHLGN